MTAPITNLAFYQFSALRSIASLRDAIERAATRHGMLGSVILSYEGINGMLAGECEAAEAFVAELITLHETFPEMAIKRSGSEMIPFGRLVVKIKPEIVTMRVEDVDPIARTGHHLAPEQLRDWLRSGEEMIFLDVRNSFEHEVGTFRGAMNPHTTAFHEFPDVVRAHETAWKQKKVVMFCTGGIRCEKASSWMMDEGFDQVYQLDGGVLNYFERIEDAHRDWEGELFVFDERVTVGTDLEETSTTLEDIPS